MASKKDPVKVIKEVSEEFVSDLGIEAKVEVREVEEQGQTEYAVNLIGEDLGVLIGYHGETLNALQLILSLILTKKLDNWTRVTLDAGDWRERRFETLQVMANHAADKAVSTKQEVALPVMASSDRRLVHMALKDRTDIASESQGEEGYRRIVIRPA